jgi:NAD(P)-dependent dehydrogenase (short-subunit alcohol dehydrogenase family)
LTEPPSPLGTVLVAGGAGVAGESVVHALLAGGAHVVVPSRSREKLDALASRADPAGKDRLHLVVGDLGSETGALRLRDEVVDRHGPPRGIVASLGGWWEGEQFADVSMDTWDRILRDNLTSHFLVARTFLPALDPDRAPVYVMLGGIAADHPEPHAAPISITGAAQRMMLRTMAVSDLGRRVRLHEVAIMTPVVTDRWDDEPPDPEWLSGEQVGSYVAGVVAPAFDRPDALVLEIPS